MSSQSVSSENSFTKPKVGDVGYSRFSTNYGKPYTHNFKIIEVNKSGKTIKISLEWTAQEHTEHVLIWTRSNCWKEKGKTKNKWTHWYIGSTAPSESNYGPY